MYVHPRVNDACIMLGAYTFGLEAHRVPLVARIFLAGDEKAPTVRRTVPRTAAETPEQFWQRVVDTVRELKAGREWNHTVSIFLRYENQHTAGEWLSLDARWNLRQIDWHLSQFGRTGMQRVNALCRLHDSLVKH
jgi:hypothetical protein